MNKLLNNSKTLLKKNSSMILACVSAVGVVATAITAVKATPKALMLLEDAQCKKGEKLTKIEKLKTAAPVYIPAVLIGAETIACIFSMDILSKRNQAALTSSYALIDTAFKEYRDKVKSLYGEDADNNIKSNIAEDKYEGIDTAINDGEQWFFDFFSMQYFKSTTENVLRAEYDFNHMLALIGYVSLNEFYNCLGIPHVDGGDQVGWSSGAFNGNSWVDFIHEDIAMKDGTKCTAIIMPEEPDPNYVTY